MKIFLPFPKDLNPYLDEIQRFSGNDFIYDSFRNYNSTYKIVNIHWPEAIFDWLEPTPEELVSLANDISHWKKNSIIVYTKHDDSRHKGMTPAFKKLFQLIENNTDVFIHLGKGSKEKYEQIYPHAQHKIIFHPLYIHSYPIFNKVKSRSELNIDKDAIVIIAPGQIRNFKERKMIIKAFEKLNCHNKVLIAPRMKNEIKYDFRGRVRLKKYFDYRELVLKRFVKNHQPPKFLFNYEKLNSRELGLRMSAADIVLIPRQKILNSGTLYLGLTYRKIIVGPQVGNITEQLKELNFPLFNPKSVTSVAKALEEGISLFKSGYSFKEEILSNFHPQKIAKEMDLVFYQLIKNK